MSTASCEVCERPSTPAVLDPDLDWSGRCPACGRALERDRTERWSVDESTAAPVDTGDRDRDRGETATASATPVPAASSQTPRPATPVAVSVASSASPVRSRLPDALLLVAELWFARRTSREILKWYKHTRREEPALAGRALYRRLLMRRSGIDQPAADRILRGAEQSFVDWKSDRDLRLRDVALYCVFEEYVRDHKDRLGASARLERVVSWLIPHSL